MRDFRISSYKKVQSFKEKEILYKNVAENCLEYPCICNLDLEKLWSVSGCYSAI